MGLAWSACRESMEKASETATNENSVNSDKRQELLGAFQRRYNFHLDIFHQPSEASLGLLIKLHQRLPSDFLPLSRVANLAEGRDLRADTSSKTKLRKELTLVLENKNTSNKSSDYWVSSEAFVHSVRILLLGYSLVSAKDSDASLWCDLQSAIPHIAKVGKFSKLDSKTGYTFQLKIREAEMATRSEWEMVSRQSPHLSLSEVIAVIANRHSLWPNDTEFPPVRRPNNQTAASTETPYNLGVLRNLTGR